MPCPESSAAQKRLPGGGGALAPPFLTRGESTLAVFSIEPDSLRRQMRRERHQGLWSPRSRWLWAFAAMLPRRKFLIDASRLPFSVRRDRHVQVGTRLWAGRGKADSRST